MLKSLTSLLSHSVLEDFSIINNAILTNQGNLQRTCYSIQTLFHNCRHSDGRCSCIYNVTHAARRLGMHRRSLQRFLGKRAPQPRGTICDGHG